jgi:hypothetical protein
MNPVRPKRNVFGLSGRISRSGCQTGFPESKIR